MDLDALTFRLARSIADPGIDFQANLSLAAQHPAFANWAVERLSPDTLLTTDELELFESLERGGHVDRLVRTSRELMYVSPALDTDILHATGVLRLSASEIASQTASLHKSQHVLSRLAARHAATSSMRDELAAERLAHLDKQVRDEAEAFDQVAHAVSLRLPPSHPSDTAPDPCASAETAIDDLLQHHDGLLVGLRKLGWELDPGDTDNADTIAVGRVREASVRLIKYKVEMIQTRLDRIYLEFLEAYTSHHRTDGRHDQKDNPHDGPEAIQAELESLYTEILPVAQMSVEQQHLEPALQLASPGVAYRLRTSAAGLAYIQTCIESLIDQTTRLTTRVGTLHAHQAALLVITFAAKTELSLPTPAPSARVKIGSPACWRKLPERLTSPARVHGWRQSSMGTSIPGEDEGGADCNVLTPLLRSLSLATLPDPGLLAKMVADRRQMADEMNDAAQGALESAVAAHVDNVRAALVTLQDCVLADSEGPGEALADPVTEASVAVLLEEVERASEAVDEVEKGLASRPMLGGVMVSRARAAVISRWG